MSAAAALLSVEGLSKAYRGRAVLREVRLEARPGEAIAVLGANGSGKSTLLGCLTGERLPDRGEIRVCGADPFSDPRTAAGCMGFVPEHPFLYEELTVRELLHFVALARGLERWEGEAERLLALLGLEGAEESFCHDLSQGMGRKVALAASLLHGPRVMVMDEVLNGLDVRSARRLLGELEARLADGATVLLSTHDLALAAEWCGRGVLLAPGARWEALEGERWEEWKRAPALDPGPAAG